METLMLADNDHAAVHDVKAGTLRPVLKPQALQAVPRIIIGSQQPVLP
jgi:hypothetical protein